MLRIIRNFSVLVALAGFLLLFYLVYAVGIRKPPADISSNWALAAAIMIAVGAIIFFVCEHWLLPMQEAALERILEVSRQHQGSGMDCVDIYSPEIGGYHLVSSCPPPPVAPWYGGTHPQRDRREKH